LYAKKQLRSLVDAVKTLSQRKPRYQYQKMSLQNQKLTLKVKPLFRNAYIFRDMSDWTGSKLCSTLKPKANSTQHISTASTTAFIITVIFLKPRTDKFFENGSGQRNGCNKK
jgi:hypothetical protein